MEKAGPEGFDPTACGSEDRRDILATLRAPPAILAPSISSVIETVIKPGRVCMPLLGIKQIFCGHEESFAYRKYDDYDFVEYCRCKRCGKVLKSFRGYDEDIRG